MPSDALEYLVTHGKTGVLGRFLSTSAEHFMRGDRVILRGERGMSVGVVLCQATERQARILGNDQMGQMLRRVNPDDEAARLGILKSEQQIFDAARTIAVELALPM